MKGVGKLCAGEPHAQFDGGSWRRGEIWQPNMAALGKPGDLSPVLPTPRYLASSLPNRHLAEIAGHRRLDTTCAE